jgi:tripartite-type tricarboxylate transporter receptor subunit TctC
MKISPKEFHLKLFNIHFFSRLFTMVLMPLIMVSQPAYSQNAGWPNKTIRLVVGFAPGGSTDLLARQIAQALSQSLGQTVVVENKPGASANISVSEVSRSTPDGYTFLVAPTTVETANPFLIKSNINPSRDLTPLMGIGRTQMYLISRQDLPVKSIPELVALAKSQPGKLSYASSGAGTSLHFAGELFKQSAGVNIIHVPYKGSGPALQDLMAGQVDITFDSGVAFPLIRTSRVKLLGVASDKRSDFFPESSSYTDVGIKNAGLDIWFGLWAPNGVPDEINSRMTKEVTKALTSPSIKQRLGELGAEPVALENVAFRKLLADESAKLSELIKRNTISIE